MEMTFCGQWCTCMHHRPFVCVLFIMLIDFTKHLQCCNVLCKVSLSKRICKRAQNNETEHLWNTKVSDWQYTVFWSMIVQFGRIITMAIFSCCKLDLYGFYLVYCLLHIHGVFRMTVILSRVAGLYWLYHWLVWSHWQQVIHVIWPAIFAASNCMLLAAAGQDAHSFNLLALFA